MNNIFDDLYSVEGKVVLVTGGSRGIGEMIASGFVARGAKVYISSRKADVCDETAKRISDTFGGTCISIPSDMSQMAGIESLVKRFGEMEDRLDVLVNNAGAAWGAPIEEFPEIGWDKVM
ncbi:MAG: SDR family NAD(P)-dependent oxidoreductase, partial [Alphaproteobacteria bacterium]|nr:SDR family NAD(P)-dependent oxidoreductase [Alphaproteobacteria bacterium]